MSKKAKLASKKTAKKVQAKKIAKVQPKKPAKKSAKVMSTKYPRHPSSPYRVGSSYGICYDILASHKDGMRRDELVKALAKETRKPERLCNFDVCVITSPGLDGKRHRSARGDYVVRKTNEHIQLILK